MDEYRGYAQKLKPFVTDAVELVNAAIDKGRRVLFEGAQGSLLDIDFGTYPFVTSSNSDARHLVGTGVPPKKNREDPRVRRRTARGSARGRSRRS